MSAAHSTKMPEFFSPKRERQYREIRRNLRSRGKSEETAEEIAARTVNKTRKRHGETRSPKKKTEGTGNPNRRLEARSKEELYNRARQLKIPGRSQLDKQGLVDAIRGNR